MTRIRDVFEGYRVDLGPHANGWAVRLLDGDGTVVLARTVSDRRDAVEMAHDWLGLIGDEREFVAGDLAEARKTVATLLNDLVTRMQSEGSGEKPLEDDPAPDLRSWFEKQWEA